MVHAPYSGVMNATERFAAFQKRRAEERAAAAYYKVQFFDAVSTCWCDIQVKHATPKAARAAYLPGIRCRTMKVEPTGRGPM
jgi:hypothetical protein